jgi:hypothetical protein
MVSMSEPTTPYNEIDDYIATFSPEQRQELAVAEMALEIAYLLYVAKDAASDHPTAAER